MCIKACHQSETRDALACEMKDKDDYNDDDYKCSFYNTRLMDEDNDFVGLKSFDFRT